MRERVTQIVSEVERDQKVKIDLGPLTGSTPAVMDRELLDVFGERDGSDRFAPLRNGLRARPRRRGFFPGRAVPDADAVRAQPEWPVTIRAKRWEIADFARGTRGYWRMA
jgi:hypothetical protein